MKNDEDLRAMLESVKDEDSPHYLYEYKCDNCGHTEFYLIPSGTPTYEYLRNKKCKNCSCEVY